MISALVFSIHPLEVEVETDDVFSHEADLNCLNGMHSES